jgi:hypothetical protein
MMPSPPIDHHHSARQSCRLPAGSAHARGWPPDCAAIAPPIPAHNPPPARSPLQPRPCLQANRSQQPLRSLILLPDLATKSP